MTREEVTNLKAQCQMRHDDLDSQLADIASILHGNGKAGLVTEVAILKEQISGLRVAVAETSALCVKTNKLIYGLAGALGGLQVLFKLM